MGKKNVFPFSESGFRLIDNNAINSLGPESDIVIGAFNANEDKDVEWYINPSSQQGVGYVYPDKKDHEILFDFNETPDDVYSGISTGTGDRLVHIFHGPGRTGGSGGGIDVDLRLIPGSIFCIGVKNKEASYVIQNFLLYYNAIPVTLDDVQDLFEFPFRSRNLIAGLNTGVIGVGNWLTYMFDGERFVFLGSNNWV